MVKSEISLTTIILTAAIIVFLALLAWRVLGDSPTLEQMSIGLTAVGFGITIAGIKDMTLIKNVALRNNYLIGSGRDEQVKLLKAMLNILKRKGDLK